MARLGGQSRVSFNGSLSAIVLVGALLLAGPNVHAVHAQEESEAVEEESAPPPAPFEAPYDGRLVRLSEIVGSVHASARAALGRYRSEGATLASEIIARFGN